MVSVGVECIRSAITASGTTPTIIGYIMPVPGFNLVIN